MLLAWANYWCQNRIHLFWFTRCIGHLRPVMAIARFLILSGGLRTAMAFLGSAKSNLKRFRSFLASAMTFPFFINVIVIRLSWYMIPLLRNWLSKIKLESHPKAKATSCNSIMFPFYSRIKTVPISSVCITCSTLITKSILWVFVFENSFWSLHRWCEAHKSKN